MLLCDYQRAVAAAKELKSKGLLLRFTEMTFDSRDLYREWLFSHDGRAKFSSSRARGHTSSPFVFDEGCEPMHYIGGCDDFLDLASTISAGSKEDQETAKSVAATRLFYQRMGDDSDEELLKKGQMILNACSAGHIEGLTAKAFLEGHPVLAKMLDNKPLNITKGVTAPDGKIFHLDGTETSIFGAIAEAQLRAAAIQKIAGASATPVSVLLNFGSFT